MKSDCQAMKTSQSSKTLQLPDRRPGHLPIRTVCSIVKRYELPLVTKNEYGRFDVMLATGEVLPAFTTLTEALASAPSPCIVHFPVTGEFDLREKTVSIQCVLCEGSGERSKWDVCPECYGRCECLYQDGYESGGCPNWVSQTCRVCNGAGGAEKIYRCGFCGGDGHVECAESAVMPSDTVVSCGMAVAA